MMQSGEWLVRSRWMRQFYRPTFRRDVFPEGRVYRVWLGWLLLKLMVKS